MFHAPEEAVCIMTNEQSSEEREANENDESSQGLKDTLQELQDADESSGGEKTSIGDVLEAFGSRAYGPLLLLPALLALIPVIGGIPGASIFLATVIILVAGQMVFRTQGLWLPDRLKQISISDQKIDKAVDKAEGPAGAIDKLIGRRLDFMTGDVPKRVAAVVCVLLAVAMYPLALVPFGVTAPAAAILLLALAITAHDGVLMTLGLIASAISAWFIWYLLM